MIHKDRPAARWSRVPQDFSRAAGSAALACTSLRAAVNERGVAPTKSSRGISLFLRRDEQAIALVEDNQIGELLPQSVSLSGAAEREFRDERSRRRLQGHSPAYWVVDQISATFRILQDGTEMLPVQISPQACGGHSIWAARG